MHLLRRCGESSHGVRQPRRGGHPSFEALGQYELLVCMILDVLANPDKERVKDCGVNATDWLKSLSSTFPAPAPFSP